MKRHMMTVTHADLTTSHRPRGSVIRADEVAPWHDGRAFLEEARRRGTEIIADAQETYERERHRGFEDGRRAGVEEAIQLVAATKAQADTFVARLETELADFVVEIVQEILTPFDAADLAARAVIKALQTMRSHAQLSVRAAPDDVVELRARLAVLLGSADRAAVPVEPDPNLDKGRCLLVSEFGQVDVTIETQLQLMAQSLKASAAQMRNERESEPVAVAGWRL
jgi:type III secretion protein L